jgi:hypothetical protein
MINEEITNKSRTWIDANGNEVFPPSMGSTNVIKTRQEDLSNHPPMSLAEKRSIESNKLNEVMDDEDRAAYERLKSKGLL